MATAEIKKRKDDLAAELAEAVRVSHRRAVADDWIARLLLLLAIASTGVASIGGLLGSLSGRIVGALALVPGGIVLFATAFKFDQRGDWQYRKEYAADGCRQRLLYQLPVEPTADQIAAISADWVKRRDELNREWETKFRIDWAAIARAVPHKSDTAQQPDNPTHAAHPH